MLTSIGTEIFQKKIRSPSSLSPRYTEILDFIAASAASARLSSADESANAILQTIGKHLFEFTHSSWTPYDLQANIVSDLPSILGEDLFCNVGLTIQHFINSSTPVLAPPLAHALCHKVNEHDFFSSLWMLTKTIPTRVMVLGDRYELKSVLMLRSIVSFAVVCLSKHRQWVVHDRDHSTLSVNNDPMPTDTNTLKFSWDEDKTSAWKPMFLLFVKSGPAEASNDSDTRPLTLLPVKV